MSSGREAVAFGGGEVGWWFGYFLFFLLAG